MKLLLVTQTVSQNDPALGFFIRWIEEFAKHCERVEVICLNEGRHILSKNVRVQSLGKENGPPRFARRLVYAFRFYALLSRLRGQYDAVFVHMNPEYVILGGPLWRLLGKRVALWYTHKSVNLKLRVATFFANVVLTASKESFRLQSRKIRVTGHGIDTKFFSPGQPVARDDFALSVGRLTRSKRHDLAIRRAVADHRELHIAGEGPDKARLLALVDELHAHVRFLGGITQAQLRDEYRAAAYLIHTSETGSLDKVVLEALACGLPVHTNDPALKTLENAGPTYVQKHHSLKALVPCILTELSMRGPDPREFYNNVVPEKVGCDYETARWRQSPLVAAQYAMTAETITLYAIPVLQKVKSILEVGPGPGTWTKLLLRANPDARYTLVDISKKMIAQAQTALPENVSISFAESDLMAFSSTESFDGFFSSRAIEYMPDKKAAAEKIASLLASGATGMIITKTPKYFFDRLRGRHVSSLHGSQTAPCALANALLNAGLRITCIRTATATVPVLNSPMLNYFAFRLLRRLPLVFPFTLFSESYCIVFKKP